MRVIQPGFFKEDVRKQQKRGKDLGKLKAVVDLLVAEEALPDRCVDHSLSGNWSGWHDCHRAFGLRIFGRKSLILENGSSKSSLGWLEKADS